MSFRCDFCGLSQPSGTKPTKIPQLIMTIDQVRQVYEKGLARAWSEASYRIRGEKQACPDCARDKSLLNNVAEVVDNTKLGLKPDIQEEEILPGFYLLYSVIALSNPSFNIVSIDKADFRKTSFRAPSFLLSF